MSSERRNLAEIVGPWFESASESGLIERVRAAWEKPIGDLTNHELATCLRQKIAVDYLLPVAKRRVADGFRDDTELDATELEVAIQELAHWCRADDGDRRIRGLPPREKA